MNIGYAIAVLQVIDQPKPVIWVLVSIFLAGDRPSSMPAMLGTNTQARGSTLLMRGYVAARDHRFAGRHRRLLPAVRRQVGDVPALLRAPAAPSTIRTCSAPFWCCPGCCSFQRMLAGRLVMSQRADAAGDAGGAAAVVLARRLGRSSRSRPVDDGADLRHQPFGQRAHPRSCWSPSSGAWSIAASSRRCSRSTRSPTCSRSAPSLDQSYDIGHYGRFGRYILGVHLALEHPLGIGPLQFSALFSRRPAQLLSQCVHVGRLARRLRLSDADRARDGRDAGCASCSCARPGSRPITRSTPPISARSLRERHHRHRPLAPLFPDPRRAVGPDGGVAGVCPADGRPRPGALPPAPPRANPGNAHSFDACGPLAGCLRRPPSQRRGSRLTERSAARLAHQSGGLGVPSSNLGAPTNKSTT